MAQNKKTNLDGGGRLKVNSISYILLNFHSMNLDTFSRFLHVAHTGKILVMRLHEANILLFVADNVLNFRHYLIVFARRPLFMKGKHISVMKNDFSSGDECFSSVRKKLA